MKKWVASFLFVLFTAMTMVPTVSAASFWGNVDRQEQQKQQNERQEKERRERERQERERQERARQERERQERARQEKERQERERQERARQERERQEQMKKRPPQRPQHNWNNPSYHQPNWRQNPHWDPLPFQWYEKRSYFNAPGYRMEPIYDRSWNDRFPGLRAYRWYDRADRGFWYRGQRITNAVMFYDAFDDLVSVGFMYNGAFIFIRDDNNAFENRDSFFVAWLR